ncbi:hypothetical protein WJ62_25215 [Burkholderia diffusa]|nr:hypothetical protein [Burkholderia diffusa]KVM93636.1 hypothetical protein WJ62_25215 [Burkholderia diffusa]
MIESNEAREYYQIFPDKISIPEYVFSALPATTFSCARFATASPPPAVSASNVDVYRIVTLPFGTRGSDAQQEMQDDEATPDSSPGFPPSNDVAMR